MEKQNIFVYAEEEDKKTIYRVRLNGEVQSKLTHLLNSQEESFFEGIEDEVRFDGLWKSDEHEIFYLEDLYIPEVNLLKQAVAEGVLAHQELNLKNFNKVKIKALFSGRKDGDDWIIQIQRFTASQVLSKGKFALIFLDNTFRKVSEPLFTVPNKIAAIVKNNRLYFKSWAVVRGIFDLLEIYEKATDEELDNFIQHEKILCEDPSNFFMIANATVRKKITALSKNSILENFDVIRADEVSKNFLDFPFVQDDRIFLPNNRKDLHKVLDFLLDNLYEAPLSGEKYRTNSKQLLRVSAINY